MTNGFIATVNDRGIPNVAQRKTLREGETLLLLEELESARTNSDLVHSLWFGRVVCVFIEGKVITATPRVCHITGPVFERFYQRDNPIAAVWELVPEAEYTESRERELAEHPLFRHLDQIAQEEWA